MSPMFSTLAVCYMSARSTSTLIRHLLVLVVGASLLAVSAEADVVSEGDVLRNFYDNAAFWSPSCEDSWANNGEWNVCQARGITCGESGRVTQINLDSCMISSTLPELFTVLDALVLLSLFNNNISGTIPTVWRSGLRQLRQLYLHNNRISGALPGSEDQTPTMWPALEILHLSNNNFSGSLPSSWSLNTNLTELRCDSCGLSGALPVSWSILFRLQTVSLYNNSLSGSLPPSWGEMRRVIQLFLHSNFFSGALPLEWSSQTALKYLFLDNNRLSGSLPLSWDAMQSILKFTAHNNLLNGTLPAWCITSQSVTEVLVHNNRLSGPLPDAWLGQPNLKVLTLAQNQLSGTLPVSWENLMSLTRVSLDRNRLTGSLPSSWGSLALLQVLTAAGNELSAQLPAEWDTMGSLQQLCLHDNKLNGTLPPEWSNLTALVELTLYNNALTGPLPDSWGQLTSLQQLNLNNNKLNGIFPATWLALLNNLQFLYLSQNRLTGTLPNLLLPRSVKELSLDFNNFSGTLPESWGTDSSRLTLLSAQGNMLTGTLPSTWISGQAFDGQLATLILSSNRLNGSLFDDVCEMQSLQRLELAFNFFSGVLPSCWAPQSLNDLETLLLNNNAFSGTLPDGWANSMQNLRTVMLHSNQLSGTLPESWGSLVCTRLHLLHLHFNILSGTVPSSWADASFPPAPLTSLALYSNRLEGALPAGWGFVLSNLNILYLHDNVFEGTLPYEWFRMQQLQLLYLQENRLNGTLPASWSGLARLTTLRLSHNAVQGTFPTEWSQGFDALRVLDVSSNRISGPLPSTIGSARLLEELHASDNDVTGPLPTTWGELNFLKVLRLSNNRRLKSSTLPSEWSLLTSLEQLWLNNCGLRGGLPETWLSLTRLQVLALNSNRLMGTVPVNWLNATAVVNVSSNCFHLPPRSVPQQQPQDACTASFSVVTSQSISFETSASNSSSSSSSASRSVSVSPSVSYSAEDTLHMMHTPTKTLKGVEVILEDEVSEATKAAAGVAVVGAAAVAVAAAAGGISEPSIGLLAMMPCAPESLGDAVDPMRYLVSPFVDFGPAAMALGNVGLFLAFFVLHMAVAFVVIRRGGIADTDVPADVASRVRFPSVSFQAALWVTQGVVFGVVATCSDELPKSVTVLEILALISSVPFLAALVGCAYWATAFSRRHVSYTETPEAEGEASLFSSLVRWLFVPRGEYTPQSMTKRFGFAFASIHAPCLGVFPLAMVAHRIVFAVVSAIPAGSMCSAQFGVLGAISGIAVAWTCVLRPHRVRVDGLFSILSNAFTMLLSLVLILYEEGAIAAEDRDGCINGISVSQSVVSVLKLLYVLRNAMEQRAKQKELNADNNSNIPRPPPQHRTQQLSLWSVVCSVAAAPLPEMPPPHHASCDMSTGVSAPLLLEQEGEEEMICPSDVLPTVWIAPTGAAEQLDVDAPLFSVPESVPQSFYLLECSDELAAPGDGVQFWGADGTALKNAEAQPDCHLEWGLPLLDTTTTAAPLDASASLVPI